MYFGQRERDFGDMSMDGRLVEFWAEEGSNDQIGHMLGQVYLNEDAYLAVHERVEVAGNSIHRTDYSYFLIAGGVEYWGYERDPTHDPPVHRHTFGHERRLEADPVSFKRVCELAWREVSVLSSQPADEADET